MDNLLNDIKEKKELLKQLPLKMKKDKIFYNESIELMKDKYNKILTNVLNEMYRRKGQLSIKKDEELEENLNKTKKQIDNLQQDMYILNPCNTELEKLGFDSSFYIIKNYSDFSYNYLMNIFNDTLDIFEKASIYLRQEEFYYNYYVNNFMNAFLKLRKTGTKDYDSLMPMFEKFYWHNPELLYHIGINFRSIANKYKKQLVKYVKSIQDNFKKMYNIRDFEDCKYKLKETYILYNRLKEEKIYNIFDLAKSGEIDIRNYLKDSKTKTEIKNELVINELKDEYEEEKFYLDLKLLKTDLEEYIKYIHIKKLVNVFKEDYEKIVVEGKKTITISNLKKIRDQINKLEKKIILDKRVYLGKRIFRKKNVLFKKNLHSKSLDICNDLTTLYDDLATNYYIYKIKPILGNPVTVYDVLYSLYSFNYYKKMQIKRAYGLKLSYNDLEEKCKKFDYYVLDPTHELINSIPIFKDEEIEKIIVTKHRLNNVALSIEDVKEDSVNETLNKVNLLLRSEIIEKSNSTAEQINFILMAEKILENEGYSENTLNI